MFDTNSRDGDFFYTWTQLTYAPRPWVKLGYAIQHTRAYQTPVDVQRGILIGFTYKQFNYSTTFFNFGFTDPTIDLSLTYSFQFPGLFVPLRVGSLTTRQEVIASCLSAGRVRFTRPTPGKFWAEALMEQLGVRT